MQRITDGEISNQWGKVKSMARAEPVTTMENGHDDLVILTAEEYYRLKRRDREVLAIEDFTEADIEAIRKTDAPPESAAFDHEVDV